MIGQESEREAVRSRANRQELRERIGAAIREDGRIEPMPGLFLNRGSAAAGPIHAVSQPSLCVIAQGRKEVLLGNSSYPYDPGHYLLVTAELPLVGHVVEATQERPYLSLRLTLDPAVVSSVLIEAGHTTPWSRSEVRAIAVSPLDSRLLDAVVRLVRLLENPGEAPVLAPLVTREVVYRLLTGEQGARLRHIAVLEGQNHRIVKAVRKLREEFDRPISIQALAHEIHMSVSALHHQFKAVTGMSPLQFQKRLQLQEARRLMLSEDTDAATAGHRVGYNDTSQFSREYKRVFGEPPKRDVQRVKGSLRRSAV